MVIAIAALLLQFSPPIQRAVPIAAAVPVVTAALAAANVNVASNLADASTYVVSGADLVAGRASVERNSEGGPFSPLSPETLQNSQSFSTIRIPDSSSGKLTARIGVERLPSRRNWIALSAVQHGAAGFDAYSTRYAISRGAVEDDPFMRPFAHSSGIYAAIQVGPLVLDYAARRMQRSQSNLIRHIWWIPQSVSTAAFLVSGAHNFRVANRP
jgi:hypothetical protein